MTVGVDYIYTDTDKDQVGRTTYFQISTIMTDYFSPTYFYFRVENIQPLFLGTNESGVGTRLFSLLERGKGAGVVVDGSEDS